MMFVDQYVAVGWFVVVCAVVALVAVVTLGVLYRR